jgi:hypothetical protein
MSLSTRCFHGWVYHGFVTDNQTDNTSLGFVIIIYFGCIYFASMFIITANNLFVLFYLFQFLKLLDSFQKFDNINDWCVLVCIGYVYSMRLACENFENVFLVVTDYVMIKIHILPSMTCCSKDDFSFAFINFSCCNRTPACLIAFLMLCKLWFLLRVLFPARGLNMPLFLQWSQILSLLGFSFFGLPPLLGFFPPFMVFVAANAISSSLLESLSSFNFPPARHHCKCI